MTVTPYTEPQIDTTVTVPWPDKVNHQLREHRQEIADLKAYVAFLAGQIDQINAKLPKFQRKD